MNIKLKIITTLLGVFFGCGIVTSQTPKAEQAMDSKRQHITEVAALTGKGDLDIPDVVRAYCFIPICYAIHRSKTVSKPIRNAVAVKEHCRSTKETS